MASQDHPSGGNRNSYTQRPSSVAGNAVSRSETENPLPPTKSEWNLSEMGHKYSSKGVKSKAQEGLEGLKTSKIARKLGEIAVANDLAYIPRMPDDALIGINEDEKHSRESYVQAHHSAIDFTRSLPKGLQPAYYNPDTHVLVPRQEQPRPHTIHPSLQAEHIQEPVFDLLDTEFMINKPSTVPAMMPSITVSTVEDTDNARNDVPSTSQRINNKPRIRPAPREIPIVPGTKLQHTTLQSADSIQKSSAQPPTQTKPTEPPPPRTSSRSHDITRRDNHSELSYSPPPTFQDHPIYDVLRADKHPPILPPIQATLSRHPTSKKSPTTAHPTRPPQYHQLRPPATWSGPAPNQIPSPNQPSRHRPKTIIPLPYNPHPDLELFLPPAQKTPPLSLEEIETFSPKASEILLPSSHDANFDPDTDPSHSQPLTRSDSQERRARTRSVRRGTIVHRQKTSQEIWEGKFEVEAESTRVRIEREMAQKKEKEKEARETKTEPAQPAQPQPPMKTPEQQATDRAAFDRRHQERLRQMQASVVADQKRARKQFQPRPNARTFQAGEEGHRMRTITRGTPRDGGRERETQGERGGLMRATARTFEMEREEHLIRQEISSQSPARRVQHAHAGEPYTRPQYQPQPQLQPQPNTHTTRNTKWQPNPDARTFEAAPISIHNSNINANTETNVNTEPEPKWQPNPNARTFETMASAGDVAAAKRYLSRSIREKR